MRKAKRDQLLLYRPLCAIVDNLTLANSVCDCLSDILQCQAFVSAGLARVQQARCVRTLGRPLVLNRPIVVFWNREPKEKRVQAALLWS